MNLLLFLLVACKEDIEPNGRWDVTITGTGSEEPCIESTEGFQQTYEYALYYDGTFVEIHVDGEPFAYSGPGCEFFSGKCADGCLLCAADLYRRCALLPSLLSPAAARSCRPQVPGNVRGGRLILYPTCRLRPSCCGTAPRTR